MSAGQPGAAQRTLCCSNCARPLRALTLDGHYGRPVEIDVCDGCCLIWFDTVESVRLSGAGITALIGEIHAAMSGQAHPDAITMTSGQHCAVCRAGLKRVFNASRFGRTSQLQCPNGHGYYQTYMLYLAEKGYVRPLLWADVRALTETGRQLFCANCGGDLPHRPLDACPYCQSAVGVLDPARLASAVNMKGRAAQGVPTGLPAGFQQHAPAGAGVGAAAIAVAPQPDQPHCPACGGAIDATRDTACPHCQAIIRRSDTASAVAATRAAIDAAKQPQEANATQAVADSRAVTEAVEQAFRLHHEREGEQGPRTGWKRLTTPLWPEGRQLAKAAGLAAVVALVKLWRR